MGPIDIFRPPGGCPGDPGDFIKIIVKSIF